MRLDTNEARRPGAPDTQRGRAITLKRLSIEGIMIMRDAVQGQFFRSYRCGSNNALRPSFPSSQVNVNAEAQVGGKMTRVHNVDDA